MPSKTVSDCRALHMTSVICFLKRVVVLFAFENITADRWRAAQMNVSPLPPPLHSLFLLLSAHRVDTALGIVPANIVNKHSMLRKIHHCGVGNVSKFQGAANAKATPFDTNVVRRCSCLTFRQVHAAVYTACDKQRPRT
ncbi:unnamed protein product [Ixodes persulcatus]